MFMMNQHAMFEQFNDVTYASDRLGLGAVEAIHASAELSFEPASRHKPLDFCKGGD